MIQYKERKERLNEGYEIQFYDENGQRSRVVAFDTSAELAFYLSAMFWGCCKFDKDFNNPTIYYNGHRYGNFDKITEAKDDTVEMFTLQ